MVEAQAAGRPVIAAADGGALEIVTDGVTGVLVKPRSVDALAEALSATDWESFDSGFLRTNAERFSRERFRLRFVTAIAAVLARERQAEDVWIGASRWRRTTRPRVIRPMPVAAARPLPGGSLARSGYWL